MSIGNSYLKLGGCAAVGRERSGSQSQGHAGRVIAGDQAAEAFPQRAASPNTILVEPKVRSTGKPGAETAGVSNAGTAPANGRMADRAVSHGRGPRGSYVSFTGSPHRRACRWCARTACDCSVPVSYTGRTSRGIGREAVGLPTLRWHHLRHLGGTTAAQSGATLAELQARLRHSTATATRG